MSNVFTIVKKKALSVVSTGPQGTSGIVYGSLDPTADDGAEGGFYINTTTNYIFGPKSGDTWPAGKSITAFSPADAQPYFLFDVLAAHTFSDAGEIGWEADEYAPAYQTGLGNTVTLNKELWDAGFNKTGGTATDGKVVYANGSQGQKFTYDYADAREGAKVSFVGVVTASTDNNELGPVTAWGNVRGLDTSAWPAGTKLYVAADATGTWTDTPPSAPNFRVLVGNVQYQHATQGVVFVNPRIDFGDGVTVNSVHVKTGATFGDLDGGNYSEVEADGTIIRNGDATCWDDITTSLIGRNLSSTAGKVDYNWDENSITMSPSGSISNSSDRIGFNLQKPHKAKTASSFYLHMHWEQPDATQRDITVRYRVQDNGEAKNATWTTAVVNITSGVVFPYTSGTLNQISALATIDLSTVGLSSTVQIQMARTDGNAGDIEVTFVDAHYEIDSDGSRQQYTK